MKLDNFWILRWSGSLFGHLLSRSKILDLAPIPPQAMERRVSDTVEVLLSLLKYFRTKAGLLNPADGMLPKMGGPWSDPVVESVTLLSEAIVQGTREVHDAQRTNS